MCLAHQSHRCLPPAPTFPLPRCPFSALFCARGALLGCFLRRLFSPFPRYYKLWFTCTTLHVADVPRLLPEIVFRRVWRPMLRLRIGCVGRETVFREFDNRSTKLFTPTLTLFTARWTGSILHIGG